MDADSSLEAIALITSLIFYGLFSSVDGYLSSGRQWSGAEQEGASRLKAGALLRNNGVRAVAQVGLVAVAGAAGVALVVSHAPHWWAVALGVVGLLVLLALVQGISAGIGARLSGKARYVLPILWPVALSALPLSALQSLARAALSGRRERGADLLEPSAALINGLHGGLSQSGEEEELAPHERRMITSILELDETTTREIMVPRMDILAAEAASSPGHVAEMMRESGHSRIPLYEESLDNIVGVVHSRDMLGNLAADEAELDLRDIVRPPLFVPDSKRLDELLRDFQENHIQIAIVVDEYGGTAGLVTVEDLLEEIVGEIEDEFDMGEPMWETLGEGRTVMDARISLEEVNSVFAVNLQGDGFDTLGGLLYQQLGKMPSPGDEIEVDGLMIKVISTLGRRIKKVQVAPGTSSEPR